MATIVRWNPVREMAAMQRAFDRLFDETWHGYRPADSVRALAFDVHEGDSAYTVVADLPGLSADQISVKLDDDVLTVSAEVQDSHNSDNARVLLQERVYGKFSRSVRLPQPVNRETVEASYENGVLTLTLPKAPEARPRLIAVKPGKVLQSPN